MAKAMNSLLLAVGLAALCLRALPAGAEPADDAGLANSLEAVDKATQQQVMALEDLLKGAPAEARPAIEHAVRLSKHGRTTVVEAVDTARARDPYARATLRWQHADSRIQELQGLDVQKDPTFAEVLLSSYRGAVQDTLDDLEEARKGGADVTQALQTVVAATAKHQAVLQSVLARVPEQARPAIEHAMGVSQHGREAALKALGHGEAAGGPPAGSSAPGIGAPGRSAGHGGGPPAGAPGHQGK
jgi:ferritin-like metal-binding protein YciE